MTRLTRAPSATAPRPPRDLWEQMDDLRQSCSLLEPPTGSFTSRDYAVRYGITKDKAYHEIARLMTAGKIKRVENCRKPCYVMA